jgi:hypothetical protein
MAKKVPGVKLKCSICKVDVTAETYAMHIQTTHATPPAPPPMTTTSMAAQMPPLTPGGFQSQGPFPISGPIMGKELAGGKYLKGDDIADGIVEVSFRVIQFVQDPQGRSKLAAQIDSINPRPMVDGKILFGFNTTNIRAIVALGILDLQQIVGKTVVCMMGMAPNPQRGGAPTKALFVARVQ